MSRGWLRAVGFIVLLPGLGPAGAMAQTDDGTVIASPQPATTPSQNPSPIKPSAKAGAPGATPQRMLLAPGCYTLQPGQLASVSAYCLDEKSPAAPLGMALLPVAVGSAASGVSDRTVMLKIGKGPPLPLDQAIARHLVGLESLGRDDYFHIGVRNLTREIMALCIPAAAMVAAGTAIGVETRDIATLASTIDQALPPLKSPRLGSQSPAYGSADELHATLQQKLWDAMAKLRQAELSDELNGQRPRCNDLAGIGEQIPQGGASGNNSILTVRCR